MKTITINVPGPVCRDFQRFAKARNRTVSGLIRDAMEEFRERRILHSTTLTDLYPVSVGRVPAPLRVSARASPVRGRCPGYLGRARKVPSLVRVTSRMRVA